MTTFDVVPPTCQAPHLTTCALSFLITTAAREDVCFFLFCECKEAKGTCLVRGRAGTQHNSKALRVRFSLFRFLRGDYLKSLYFVLYSCNLNSATRW